MAEPFVPADFDVPIQFEGPGFRLEPLGSQHNERDHTAWMSSVDHIKSTPGFEVADWPARMSLERNLSDLVGHARDFDNRDGFTYSILDGDEVIGCVYIYPSPTSKQDAQVSSWVRQSRSTMDWDVWRAVLNWLETAWPFEDVSYAARSD